MKEKEHQLSLWKAYLQHLSIMQIELDKSRSKSQVNNNASKGPSRGVTNYID